MGRLSGSLPVVAGAVVAAALLRAGSVGAAPPQAAPARPATETATFKLYIRASQVGTEDVTVASSPDGWTITSTGRSGPPLDLVTRKLEIRYDANWRPLELTVDAAVREQPLALHTVVTGTSARSQFTNGGAPAEKVDTIDPAAVLAPNPFFAAYEALAARLSSAAPGAVIPVYVPPMVSLAATVEGSRQEKIQTVDRLIDARRTQVTTRQDGGPSLALEIWSDERGRLLRFSVPSQALDIIREDIASVSTRRVVVTRAGDESVRIPANGFSLGGTVSKPPAAAAQGWPAVVLVGGSGPTDRDETIAGIPVFGQLAGALADSGFLVLRYDRRGVGQSGGRPESATLADYAEDVRAAVRYVGGRPDVNRRRIAVVGHGEGGPVGMIAAARENRIAALVLVAAIGVTGAEGNLAQVSHALSRSTRTEAERQTTLDLQRRIQTAVLTGQGWEGIPPELRARADVPWFQSFLSFDPAKAMAGVRQPVLVVQGLLDTQVAPANADRLEALAKARQRAAPVAVVRLPGVNHLLVPATTGEADEYASLGGAPISPAVPGAIAEWLGKTMVGR